MKDRIGGFIAGKGLLAEMLVGLRQTLHLGEPGVQRHRWVGSVLRDENSLVLCVQEVVSIVLLVFPVLLHSV